MKEVFDMDVTQDGHNDTVNGEKFQRNRLSDNVSVGDSSEKLHCPGVKSASCSGDDMRTKSQMTIAANDLIDVKGDNSLLPAVCPEKREQCTGPKKYKEELDKLGKQLLILTQRLDAEVNSKKLVEDKLSMAKSTIATQKREILLLQRQLQSGPSELSDRRLEAPLRDIALLKPKLSGLGGAEKVSQGGDASQLQTSLCRVSAERDELLNCVKKQSKLIEVLKQQKLHLEASILADISEKELGKYFDLVRR
ncbi:hypothetical protein TraAM80_05562 [Trypanosoma rangeli]|uniref:Uncharacterized protein n=1 Tax=Trypanosoma rangeli TaxID=5698 RepID=A0A3R7KLA5_TRYRA|nr:uncharacterized protein TraAM80_05562 [Trypanosoma rangeli]RNF03739.1 hypothetical protein TraAM80_05562 [Trypanosoma rangeli]|eukprot:RNF03739.1 hypothetical protein TraAM80_05562 [Trypanosoma rangeli]